MIRRKCAVVGVSGLRKQMFPVSGESVCCGRGRKDRSEEPLAWSAWVQQLGDIVLCFHKKNPSAACLVSIPTLPWEDTQWARLLRWKSRVFTALHLAWLLLLSWAWKSQCENALELEFAFYRGTLPQKNWETPCQKQAVVAWCECCMTTLVISGCDSWC